MTKNRKQEKYLSFNLLYFIAQIATTPYCIFLKFFFRVTVYHPSKFNVPNGTLILANHESKLDPFFVIYNLGARNLISILPFRAPVTSKFMVRPILGKLISLIGGYNIGETPIERAKKLLFTKNLLAQGQTVLLFPEGKIIKRGHIKHEEFKKGAHMLFSQNYPVVFVRLIGLNKMSFKHPFKKYKRHLHYSPVIKSSDINYKIKMMEEFFEEKDICK